MRSLAQRFELVLALRLLLATGQGEEGLLELALRLLIVIVPRFEIVLDPRLGDVGMLELMLVLETGLLAVMMKLGLRMLIQSRFDIVLAPRKGDGVEGLLECGVGVDGLLECGVGVDGLLDCGVGVEGLLACAVGDDVLLACAVGDDVLLACAVGDDDGLIAPIPLEWTCPCERRPLKAIR